MESNNFVFKQYAEVKISTDKFRSEGVTQSSIGYIIEIYDNNKYEVEFSNSATGETIAQLVLDGRDIAAT